MFGYSERWDFFVHFLVDVSERWGDSHAFTDRECQTLLVSLKQWRGRFDRCVTGIE